MDVQLPFLLGMCIAVIIAIHTLFSRPRWRDKAEASPKDDSLRAFPNSYK
jgi:hypothetical protein